MAFTDIVFYSFCIGAISTLLVAVIIRASYKRYRIELVELGGAQTQLGSIGSIFLEGKNPALIGISVSVPIMVTIFGGVGLYVQYLFQYLGTPTFTILLLMHSIGSIIFLLLLVWFTMFTENGKARLIMNRVLLSYHSLHNEEILRLELLALRAGDKNQRKAFDLFTERGCAASLVARNIIAESA